MAKINVDEKKKNIEQHTNDVVDQHSNHTHPTNDNQSQKTTIVTTNSENKKNIKPDSERKVVYSTQNLDLWYGENHALQNINLDILENNVTAIIGPLVVVNQRILKH